MAKGESNLPFKGKQRVRTLEQAYGFVRAVQICLIFAAKKPTLPALWDAVDLPDKQPGETGWGQKIGAVWRWKNELPAVYPEEIYYGKDQAGKAVLMMIDYLTKIHYPKAHVPVAQCSQLAQQIYNLIRIEPMTTPALRKAVVKGDKRLRAAFSKALIELQVTLNIVRSNAPEVEADTWLRFHELYPKIACGGK